jgi:hypothetical protein
MRHSKTTIQAVILSMKNLTMTVLTSVSTEEEVFNNLIEVRRHDTKEVGTLLCSHCCKWPEELKEKATWLEGCYTPSTLKGDSRLLMGYHPKEITRWKVEKVEGELLLHLNVPLNPHEENQIIIEDVAEFLPLYLQYDVWEDLPKGNLIKRYWRTIVTSEAAIELRPDAISRVAAFYRSVSANPYIPKYITIGLWDFCIIKSFCEEHDIHFNGNIELQHEENCEHYADALVVVNDKYQKFGIAFDIENMDFINLILKHFPQCVLTKYEGSTTIKAQFKNTIYFKIKYMNGCLYIFNKNQQVAIVENDELILTVDNNYVKHYLIL